MPRRIGPTGVELREIDICVMAPNIAYKSVSPADLRMPSGLAFMSVKLAGLIVP